MKDNGKMENLMDIAIRCIEDTGIFITDTIEDEIFFTILKILCKSGYAEAEKFAASIAA